MFLTEQPLKRVAFPPAIGSIAILRLTGVFRKSMKYRQEAVQSWHSLDGAQGSSFGLEGYINMLFASSAERQVRVSRSKSTCMRAGF